MKKLLMWIGLIDDPEAIAKERSVQELNSEQVQVVRLTVFRDDIAYHDKRGVYVITDTISGKTFLGVSGIGISELGSHTEGTGKHKRTVSDER